MRTTGQFFIPRNSWKCACGEEGGGAGGVKRRFGPGAVAGRLLRATAGCETGTK